VLDRVLRPPRAPSFFARRTVDLIDRCPPPLSRLKGWVSVLALLYIPGSERWRVALCWSAAWFGLPAYKVMMDLKTENKAIYSSLGMLTPPRRPLPPLIYKTPFTLLTPPLPPSLPPSLPP